MKYLLFIECCLSCLNMQAQISFKTIVPQEPVVAGESFQVQYILSDAGKVVNVKAPAFSSFRFVSGPNQYDGSAETINGKKTIRNFVYTLQAIATGRFIIPGAVAVVDGKKLQSNDAAIEVIAKKQTAQSVENGNTLQYSDYILMPGEDADKKIKQNLFLKLVVDRTTCFAGEPILATYKLYSRLESSSVIVKNPGFYGFTVHDMINLSDNIMNKEMVDGKLFDVHIIRKAQLFPLQAGNFIIDAIEINNRVEFSKAGKPKVPKQEITEGSGVNDQEKAGNENTTVFENSLQTEPLSIRVKPLPEKNRPDSFTGAVGSFFITAYPEKKSIAKNEEGVFVIRINGRGNFTQLTSPVFDWPDGIEGFEPVVSDSLDKTKIPLSGGRSFRYAFTGSQAGHYQVPAVSFSFFDPAINDYKTITAAAADIAVTNTEKENIVIPERKVSITEKNKKASRTAFIIVIFLIVLVLTYWIIYKNKPEAVTRQETVHLPTKEVEKDSLSQLINLPEAEFFPGLYRYIWKHLGDRFQLRGSTVNKTDLISRLKQYGVENDIISGLQKILSECESGIYTGIITGIDKKRLLLETKETLERISLVLL